MMPRRRGEVTPRAMRSRPTEAKSSNVVWRFVFRPASCQAGPNSPPPRMLASTQTPPCSSHSLPIVGL